MDLQAEIRQQVGRYLSQQIPIRELWSWTQEHFWDIDNREASETARMAHDVELLLFETAHGDWTEHELREKLRPVVSRYEFSFGRRPLTTVSAASGRTIILTPSRGLQPA